MYTSFYHFTEKPFNLTPDPKFLFYTPSHREALASMIYGINERRGFVVITGEVGTGKTTLIYTLLNNLNEKVKTAFVYHTTATFEQLLGHILIDLNVPVVTEDKMALLQKLNDHLVRNIAQDETLAIIIDEAQNLPSQVLEELRLLSNLETTKQKLIQILLVGQSELEAKLDSQELRQLKQRIGIRRTIKPLTLEESREYIEHRLNVAGSTTSQVFTSDAVALICKHANGIPRMINILCDNAFLIGYSLSKEKIPGKIIGEVVRDLGIDVEKPVFAAATDAALPPAEPKPPSRNISFYLVSFILLIMLTFISLSIRGYFKQKPVHENVPQLTEITPEVQPPPPEVAQQPPATVEPAPLQPEPQKPAAKQETQREPAPKKPITLNKPKAFKSAFLSKGKSLYSLAIKNYGKANPTIYDLILHANPGITDIRGIPDRRKIILPAITPESFIQETAGDYSIFIGTFESSAQASQCAAQISSLGKNTLIKAQKFSPSETWYRLTAGTFATPDEALAAINLLIKQGIIFIPSQLS
jgi:type II secretory pathway predicted ATPase ExeA/phage tail protein X